MFSKTTEYALRAAVYLSEQIGTKQTSMQVAEATQTPPRYASRVLQHLVDAGLATSQRGPTGGFELQGSPDEISLLDVVQAVEPIERIRACPLGLIEHSCELCPLHKTMDRVAEAAESILAETSLAASMQQKIVPLGLGQLGGTFPVNGSNGS